MFGIETTGNTGCYLAHKPRLGRCVYNDSFAEGSSLIGPMNKGDSVKASDKLAFKELGASVRNAQAY